MINITGTTASATMLLADTTIGTCNYSARVFDATGEVVHNVEAANGIKLQWITPITDWKLATIEEDAVAKIAELRPAPEPNPQLPPPEGMSETDKIAW